ncbi:MAG TPA: PQQ-dependent sugar dehydrogenase, partial [Pseudonocardiaceae bacterium]
MPQSTGVEAGLFAAGKDGKIAWVPGIGSGRLLCTIPNVRSDSDAGLLAVTPAVDYATSGVVYVLYVRQASSTSNVGALEAWKVNSTSQPTSIAFVRAVVDGSQGLTNNSLSHMVGDLLVAPDGSLFFSQGDDASSTTVDTAALRAQDVSDPHGKIFHVLPDGRGATNNQYYDSANPNSWKTRVCMRMVSAIGCGATKTSAKLMPQL